MSELIGLGLLLMLLTMLVLPATAALDVPLTVANDQPVDRVGEPLASGIPLPQGAATDPAHLRVLDPTGKQVPCQVHQLGLCWPDGSLRWVLVQFFAAVKGGGTATYRLVTRPQIKVVLPSEKLTVRETTGAVEITTGPLRVSLSKRDFRLPGVLAVREGAGKNTRYVPLVSQSRLTLRADRETMTPEEFKATGRDPKDLWQFGLADSGEIKWGQVQPTRDYSDRLTGAVKVKLEETGPVRAVVRLESAAEKREGEVGFVARLYAYAGKPYVRVEYTLESYEQFLLADGVNGYQQAIVNNKHVRELTLSLGLPAAASALEFGGPEGALAVSPAASPALRQTAPDRFTLAGGTSPAKTDRAPGWVTATAGRHRLSLATKWFWETAPRGLSYDAASRELALELWPASTPAPGYPLPAGRVKTHEFALGVDTDGRQLSALARAELRAHPDPTWAANTGATHRFVSTTDPRFPGYGTYVANSYRQDSAVRRYGDMDFGDQIGWNDKERWNGYHGVEHDWFTFYLASGQPELFRLAEAHTWHSLDADTQHWGYLPGCHEAEYGRAHDHVCAAYYQGGIKVWVLGEVDYYFLTGRRRVLESLERSTQFLLHCGGMGGKSYTTERATSLPFLHLAHLYGALGDEAALTQVFPGAMKAGAGRFRRDSIGAPLSSPLLATLQDVCAHFNRVYDKGEHTQCSFLASYPAEALHQYYLLTGDPAAVEGLKKAARFLYQDMAMPTGILMYAGGKPWADDSPWLPWWDGVEAPAALAYMVTGDKFYLDWGKAPVDWVLNFRQQDYSSGPWSWQGAMGFGGTLGTYLWALGQAGMTQEDIRQLRPDLDYEAALRACRERCEAFREKAMQNSGESGTYCRLAGDIGRVLLRQGKVAEAIAWLEPWSKAPYGVYPSWVLRAARAEADQQK